MALHVTPQGSKWTVRASGKKKARYIEDEQQTALEKALKCKDRPIYLHDTTGRITERIAS